MTDKSDLTQDIAESLLREQSIAVEGFRKARDTFAQTFDALHFPLGSPIEGYDLADIDGVLADWIKLRDDDEDMAMILAQTQMMEL
jgi:hypothetical protein